MITRLQYLQSIGLSFDPFELTAAEQEVGDTQDIPKFFNYLSLPRLQTQDGKELTFHSLRDPRHLFIFAEPGMGKTTLKYQVNADCRSLLDDKTMTVIYNFGGETDLSDREYGSQLARELVIDLLIHVVEQYSRFRPGPSKQQIEALAKLIPVGEIKARRLLERLLEHKQLHNRSKLGAYWSFVGRPAVKVVPDSPALQEMLRALHTAYLQAPALPAGWDAVEAGLEAAHEWGFDNVLVLMDGLDAHHSDPVIMIRLLQPFLHRLGFLEKRHAFAKIFLPVEVKEAVQNSAAQLNLSYPPENAIIIWDKSQLSNLVTERIRAAGMAEFDLNLFASKELPDVHHRAIELACGSPRRLLLIINALIDAHMQSVPSSETFLAKDWEKMERDLKVQDLLPCQKKAEYVR